MEKKPYVGIRIKALSAVVLLVLVPSLFLAAFTYHIENEAVRTAKNDMLEELNASTSDYIIKLNMNATSSIEKYMEGIEIEGRSAANLVPDYLGKDVDVDAVWGSKDLLKEMNITLLTGIMDGSMNNSYYARMISELNKSYVDSVLDYFINPPEMNYSTAHINDSAYAAINDLRRALGNDSYLLYDFFRSTMLPEYREKLDYILPVGDMLYAFREAPDILWSYFASPDGSFIVLIPSDAEFSPLFNPLVRKWYKAALEKGEGTWSGEYIDEITKEPVVTFSVPIYRNGTLLGVLGFDVLLSTLSEKTRQFYTGGKSFAFTVSSDGTALTYPNESLIGHSLISGDSDFNNSVRNITEGDEGVFHTYVNGKKVFMAYSTIESTGWKFVNVVYCDEMMERSESAADSVGRIVQMEITYLLSIIVSVGLIAFVATFFLVDAFVRGIEKLTKVADDVSRGNLDVEVEVDAKDEIGDLQKAIKRMVNSIKVAMKELEEGEKRGR